MSEELIYLVARLFIAAYKFLRPVGHWSFIVDGKAPFH